MATALVTRTRRPLPIAVLAREAGVSPELARRFVGLGLVDSSAPWDAPALVARAARLRRDLSLNAAGAALACELLARIDELEARLARYERRPNGTR